MLPMTNISQLISQGAAEKDESLEQSPDTGSKTTGANMPSKAAAGAGFISTFAEMA